MRSGRSSLIGDHEGPLAARTAVPPLQVVESRVLTVTDGQSVPASVAAILHGFDQIRRRVAMSIAGQVGIFVGYDPLDLLLETMPPSNTLLLVGCTLDAPTIKRHRVRYTAYAVIDGLRQPSPWGSEHLLIVRAVGVTLTPKTTSGCTSPS